MIQKRAALASIFMLVFTGICAAQALSPDLVFVNATVTGPKKAPAPGLKVENFQLFEDGVEQKITYFSDSDGPWDVNVVLANSMVLPGRADRVSNAIRDAVETFKKSSNPMSRIKVEELHFGSDGLYASIDRNLEDLQKSQNPRRALVVITDGFDTAGGDAANGLVEYSRKLNLPIYFMFTRSVDGTANAATNSNSPSVDAGVRGANVSTSSTGARGSNYSQSEAESLTNVAEQTGGAIDFVDAETELGAKIKLLGAELRSKYVLGFKSTNDKKDDKWRKLKVTLKNPPAGPKLEATMKPKYFVPKPK